MAPLLKNWINLSCSMGDFASPSALILVSVGKLQFEVAICNLESLGSRSVRWNEMIDPFKRAISPSAERLLPETNFR